MIKPFSMKVRKGRWHKENPHFSQWIESNFFFGQEVPHAFKGELRLSEGVRLALWSAVWLLIVVGPVQEAGPKYLNAAFPFAILVSLVGLIFCIQGVFFVIHSNRRWRWKKGRWSYRIPPERMIPFSRNREQIRIPLLTLSSTVLVSVVAGYIPGLPESVKSGPHLVVFAVSLALAITLVASTALLIRQNAGMAGDPTSTDEWFTVVGPRVWESQEQISRYASEVRSLTEDFIEGQKTRWWMHLAPLGFNFRLEDFGGVLEDIQRRGEFAQLQDFYIPRVSFSRQVPFRALAVALGGAIAWLVNCIVPMGWGSLAPYEAVGFLVLAMVTFIPLCVWGYDSLYSSRNQWVQLAKANVIVRENHGARRSFRNVISF